MAVAALPDTLIDELVADLRRGSRLHRQVGALQPRPRAFAVSVAQVGGAHPAGGRAADLGRADLRGRQAREPPPRPCRPARRRHRAHGRRRTAQARDRRRREADEQDPRDRRRGPHGDGAARDQHAEAVGGAAAARLHLPGQPRLVPVLARRRSHRHERLVADRRQASGTRAISSSRSRSCSRPARSSGSATVAGRRSASHPPATSSSTSSWGTRERSASSPRRRSSW